MKAARRKLLDTLQGRQPINSEEPFKNIKQALGSLANTKGNPLTKAEVRLQVSLRYYDPTVTAVILPAALPAAAQNRIPIYLFGLTDFWGSYNNMVDNVPVIAPWIRPRFAAIGVPPFGIYGTTTGLIGGAPPVTENFCDFGDMIQTYFVWPNCAAAIIHCNNVAYGTFLNNFSSDTIYLSKIRFFIPLANINQLDNPITFSYQSQFGARATDSIDLKLYGLPTNMQANIIDLPVNMPVDKNFSMGFYQNFDCTDISMILFIEKVTR